MWSFGSELACWSLALRGTGAGERREKRNGIEGAGEEDLLLFAEKAEAFFFVFLALAWAGFGCQGNRGGQGLGSAGGGGAMAAGGHLGLIRARSTGDGLHPRVHLLVIFGLEEILIPICSFQFEHMLLLLVVEGDLTCSILQADGDLVVIGDALAGTLNVFVEAHFPVVDHTIHIVPGSAGCLLVVTLPLMFAVQDAFHLVGWG